MARPLFSATILITRCTKCWAHVPMGRSCRMQVSESQNYSSLSLFDFRQTRVSATRRVVLVVFCLIMVTGCDGTKGGPSTVEVTGTITVNGTPIDGANVLFMP